MNDDPHNRRRAAGPHVVLIGPMGCGKTTVGGIVAARLHRELADNDAGLASMTGMTARRIVEEFGTAELHRFERAVFEDALATPDPAVITAAASVLDVVDAAQLDGELVVFLDCSAPVGARRASTSHHRPSIMSTTEAQGERRRRAAELADLVIDVDDLDAQQVADRIVLVDLTALTRHGGAGGGGRTTGP